MCSLQFIPDLANFPFAADPYRVQSLVVPDGLVDCNGDLVVRRHALSSAFQSEIGFHPFFVVLVHIVERFHGNVNRDFDKQRFSLVRLRIRHGHQC